MASLEAIEAYSGRLPHLKLESYVNIANGAVDFLPGLSEIGVDLPIPLTKIPHLAMRIQSRALFYRSPNFNNAALSTRQSRATSEPTAGLIYRF